MKGSARARQALEANLLIEWVDPLGDGAEPCFHQAHARDIAATRRRQEPRYESDEAAVEDFMVVYWANIQEKFNQMTLPQIAAREEMRALINYPAMWDTEAFPSLDEAVVAILKAGSFTV